MNAAQGATPTRGLVALLGCFMMLQPLSTDLYLASMPGLTQRFAASMATVQLTLSVFALGFATMAAAVAGASVVSLATVAFLLRPMLANTHPQVPLVAITAEFD